MERNVFNNATIVKSNGAILTPQLGTADLAGISPQVGQIAYNIDTGKLIVYTTDWKDVAIAGGSSGAFDNLLLSGNTLSSTNTNGNIILSPNGTGTLQVTKGANFNSNTVSGITTLTATTVTVTNLGGTLTTAAQPNVTSLGTQASNLDMNTNKVINLGTPTLTTDATTKTYVDSADNLKLNLSGGTMSGAINMGSNAISGVTTLTAITVTATNIGGTLTTAAQTNVTSLGAQAANLNMNTNKIINLATPTLTTDATTKTYVDSADNLKLNLSGGTMSGAIAMGSNAISGVTTLTATTVTATNLGGTLTTAAQTNVTSLGAQAANLNMNTNKIINLGTPTLATDATTKTYVDTLASGYLPLAGGTMAGAVVMGSNKLSGQLLSRPWLALSTGSTATQGAISWSGSTANSDFSSYITSSGQFITFSVTGFYRITASLTFFCSNAVGPERQVFGEFRTAGTIFISASDQLAQTETGNIFANISFNQIINITSTAGSTYYFNWGSFSTANASLTGDSHATIERMG